jgi:lycopene cyclase domain-containing protein
MPDYPVLTLIAVVAVIVVELAWLRTGVFRSAQYWITMAIVFGFQVLVDGWLTKLSNPIVIYNPATMLGIRAPWDIPVEDFGFGFAMVTLAIVLWQRGLGKRGQGSRDQGSRDRGNLDRGNLDRGNRDQGKRDQVKRSLGRRDLDGSAPERTDRT